MQVPWPCNQLRLLLRVRPLLPIKGAPAAAQDAMPFMPVKIPMPLESDGVTLAEQVANYSTFAVQDDLVLLEGYTYDVIGSGATPWAIPALATTTTSSPSWRPLPAKDF